MLLELCHQLPAREGVLKLHQCQRDSANQQSRCRKVQAEIRVEGPPKLSELHLDPYTS